MPSAQSLRFRSSLSIGEPSPQPQALDLRSLSESGLVARLLSISELEAARLLRAQGGLSGVVGASPVELAAGGLREVSAASPLAAVELGARLARREIPQGRPLEDRAATARYLWLRYAVRWQEVFGAMLLDGRGRLLLEREFFRGTISRVALEPAPVLRVAFSVGAPKILLFHTHPSGNPKPSGDDILATRRFGEAAELVGLEVVDHLVVAGPEAWASVPREVGV